MGVVPAKVAGVEEVVLCSPPGRRRAAVAVVLAAAALSGRRPRVRVGRCGRGGGDGLRHGERAARRPHRRPGNAYVAEAKVQVSSVCAIDSPAGPSELLVIADHAADPVAVAREMIAQAEHDPLAAVVCVAVGDETAEQVIAALADLAPDTERREIVEAALAAQGGVLIAQTYDEATAFATDYAAEHLLLAIGEPEQKMVLSRLRNTGTVFLGETSSVAYGDYMTGANHVLPTGGLARSYSGLSTLDFVRWTTYQRVTPQAAAKLAYDVGRFADAEGLPGPRRGGAGVDEGARRRAHAAQGAGVPEEAAGHRRRRRGGRGARRRRAGRVARRRDHSTATANDAGIQRARAQRRLPLEGRPEYRDIPLYAPGTAPCATGPERHDQPVGRAAGGARRGARGGGRARVHLPGAVQRGAEGADRRVRGGGGGGDRHRVRLGRRDRLRAARLRAAGRAGGARRARRSAWCRCTRAPTG
jgi:histidinol dehydrogenase